MGRTGASRNVGTDKAALNYKPLTRVDYIIVHCSATREGQDFSAKDIDGWHRKQGWRMIGYHKVVKLDGTVENGRPENQPGAHAEGYNSRSLGICYIGGVAADGKTPKDTRTPAQKAALLTQLRAWKARYPNATVIGHGQLPKVAKACPSFPAREEYANL